MQVEVYRNLHTGSWSIRSTASGRVVDRADTVYITGAKLVVRPAGRAKVLQEQRKNVHAFIRGTWEAGPVVAGPHHPDQQVSYNPYKAGNFVMRSTGEPVTEANSVTLTHTGQAYIG